MAYSGDWYQHLVDQSRTDHIYDLIHNYLWGDWGPDHEPDFVTVRRQNLPAQLRDVPKAHIATSLKPDEYCFPGDDYVLLHHNHLTEYLEAAKEMDVITDAEDREFIELLFRYRDVPTVEKSDVDYRTDFPDPYATTPETLANKEDGLGIAYNLLAQGTDRALALRYAEVGKAFLDSNPIEVDNPDTALHALCRQMMGYNIVAMVYAWNNQIDKAAEIDRTYLHMPLLWDGLAEVIKPYLEMLMAKKQTDYLEAIFSDEAFRQRFRAHYEVYISLLVNPHFEWTQRLMGEMVPIINRVNNSFGLYR